jgi:hypothetical protein
MIDRRALEAAADGLLASRSPYLIGVRHHSPACAAAMPEWLEEAQPERLFVELPAETEPWMVWVGHPALVPPVALAAGGDAFWPFASFSPELVAIRWAVARGIPVECFDLPIARRARHGPEARGEPAHGVPDLPAAFEVPDWDTVVEAPAVGSTANATRRAALLYGWALRRARGASTGDLAREAWMRARLATFAGRAVVVTGAFHDAALVADVSLDPVLRSDELPPAGAPPVVSLVPWRLDLLDMRSGYPAGVSDPAWHARVFERVVSGGSVEALVGEVMVEVVRAMRAERIAAGTPDATEATRMALTLAQLRGLSAPGRAEVLEAIGSTMTQGELLGRGRVVARALQRVMVGTGRGQLAPGTPRSGLLVFVEGLVAALRLPGPEDEEEKLVRLDPLRSDLDRRRQVVIHRLAALHVPYAKPGSDAEDTLTTAWRLHWEPGTEASVELAGMFGVTLEQAVTGALTRERPRDDGDEAARGQIEWATRVAECGLPELAVDAITELGSGEFVLRARLGEMVSAVVFVDKVVHGHIPGLQPEASPDGAPGAIRAFRMGPEVLHDVRVGLYTAAVRSLDGLLGSTDPADGRALGALVRLARQDDRQGDARLGAAVDRLATEGKPRISGCAAVARVRLGRSDAATLGAELGVNLIAAEAEEARRDFGDRLAGVLAEAGPMIEASTALLDGIGAPIEELPDQAFLSRLPCLRHGFDALSVASRERLLAVLRERLGDVSDAPVDIALAQVDAAARLAVEALGLWPHAVADLGAPDLAPRRRPVHNAIPPIARWRLVLGREGEFEPAVARYAAALDELYGPGHGEGSRGERGGRGSRFPTAREWTDEIAAIFGEDLRVEVAARAAERGDPNALLTLDPESVTPSIALLEQALSLRGGLGEDQLAALRRMCRRVTDALVEALAVRVRPAMSGLSTPRPTLRRTQRLHLARTVSANLRTARMGEHGWTILPERPYFRSRARREMDWHVILVVDTSGSMEASVIYAAMMAAILSSLPAVSVSFYAFADEVVDFSDRVDDPLALLLEVEIGGGTRIHRALRYARERVRVPTRTLLVLVSDFEEGGSVSALLAEVRALVESGVTPLGLASLDDQAQPRFSEAIAGQVAACGMPVAALSPLELARWVAEKIR